MKMKKLLAVVVLVALLASVASVVTACVDFGNEVTVTFYHTMSANLREVLDKYIVKFNEIYPNIIIEHEQSGGWGDIQTNVLREITIGEGPTMTYCYPDHVADYDAVGKMTNMFDYIDSTATVAAGMFGNEDEMAIGLTADEKADFIQRFYNEGTVFGEDKMYMLPFAKSTEVLYYNKTVFDARGLTPPTHWWCDENCPADCSTSVEKVCAAIKEFDPDCRPFGYDSDDNLFITLCEQLGTDYTQSGVTQPDSYYIFNNDENVAFLTKLNEMYKKGYIITKGTNGGKYTSNLFTKTGSGSGKSYMCVGSTGGGYNQRPDKVNGEYAFEVGIAPIPQMDQSNPKVISQGPNVCMFNNGTEEQRLATWLFIKFLTTSREFQAEFAMASGYTPVLQSVRDESLAEYDENGEPLNQIATFIDFLKTADGGDGIAALACTVCLDMEDYYFISPAFSGSAIARSEVGNALTGAMYLSDKQGQTIAQQIRSLLDTAQSQCEYEYKTPVAK